MVPIEEFAAAVRWVMIQALSISNDDLVRETARILGVGREAKGDARVRLGLGLLQQRGLCAVEEERVIWRD